MGTRHLTAVVADGQFKIAQYGQWDGYPGGQGATVLAFCREHLATESGRAFFRTRLAQTRFLDEEELQHCEMCPSLSRDTGAGILALVWDAPPNKVVPLSDESAFAAESLFCEWAYVVDLDKNTLEAFVGFNKTPLAAGERFAAMSPVNGPRNGYYPVRLGASWSLDNLPVLDAFTKALNSGEE